MTLRQLWLMHDGAVQARRLLALDVRSLVYTERIDADRYLRTGVLIQWSSDWELPDTPLMRKAMEDLEREREQHRKRGYG